MNTRTYNNTVRDLMTMADAMNRAWGRTGFSYDYGRNGGSNGESEEGAVNGTATRTAYLPVNAWANEDAFFVQANLPGVNPDNVEITFDKETLVIRGEFPAVSMAGEEENVEFIKRELFSGPFERKLTFRTPVDVDGIKAVFENGTLTLTVPKAEEAKPRQIKVQAK